VAPAELLPSAAPPEPLTVLREQAERLFGALLEKGDREAFLRLNPLLALLVEAAGSVRPSNRVGGSHPTRLVEQTRNRQEAAKRLPRSRTGRPLF
jgi:hypothetical protein